MNATEQTNLQNLAEEAIRIVERVMDATDVLSKEEQALRGVIARLADIPTDEEHEGWKRDTIQVWRETADSLAQAAKVLK